MVATASYHSPWCAAPTSPSPPRATASDAASSSERGGSTGEDTGGRAFQHLEAKGNSRRFAGDLDGTEVGAETGVPTGIWDSERANSAMNPAASLIQAQYRGQTCRRTLMVEQVKEKATLWTFHRLQEDGQPLHCFFHAFLVLPRLSLNQN